MSDVHSRFQEIHVALAMGAEPVVQAVQYGDGRWMVRWGVDGLDMLDTTPAGARHCADVFEAHGYAPDVRRLMRLAADMCDRKTAEAAP